jgi:hypothetical protein
MSRAGHWRVFLRLLSVAKRPGVRRWTALSFPIAPGLFEAFM